MTTAAPPRGVAAGGVAVAAARVVAVLARVPAVAWALALAAVLRAAYGRPQVGYDAWWALAWGRQVAGGGAPELTAAVAPTPHPLAVLVAVPVSVLGDGAPELLAWLSLGACAAIGVVAATLGARLFGPIAGGLAALILLTRPLLVGEALQCSVDVPFLALALGAGAALAHRDGPRHGRALALLAVAGLLRPEAWLLAVAVALWVGVRERRRWRRAAVAAAVAPVAWLLFDLVCSGDPLHSLHGTRELADGLGRPQSLGTALRVAPDYLTVVLGDHVALLGGAAAVAALWLVPRRAALPLATVAAGVAGFLVLGVAGLPLLYRYTLLPAAALALLAAWAPTVVLATPDDGPKRAAAGVGAAVAVIALALSVSATLDGLQRQSRIAAALGREQRDLTALARAGADACRSAEPLVAQQRPVPQLAFLLDRPAATIRVGGTAPARGLVFTPNPGSLAIGDRLAPGDRPAPDPAATTAARPLATRGAWTVLSSC
jgi:hypothetical protein